ncbi:N-acetylmuramic acid 6-phosphate etherase [Primorskyibacter sp. 2E233]|uniref:N-acetylmuramic acid 6-phosphate etherase n=1 Tax=Primorskyibacter sp. 2E233 TaxID=3413431 RepID=UPI003BF20F02
MHHAEKGEGVGLPIDALTRGDALSEMLASHLAAVSAVSDAQGSIDAAASHVASAVAAGATLFYAAAGSSGLMALADASELPGTFGVPAQQIRICMAGGVPVDGVMPGDTEDGTDEAAKAAQSMQPQDLAIVVSASGTTPFAIAFAKAAKAQGARVVAIANVADSPLLGLADVAIALVTAAEVVDGSTRLGAGTAQKVALNMMSTQAGILLGHVHGGQMVNLVPDNIKLRHRARRIVAGIAAVHEAKAERALERAGNDTKLAVLIATGLDIETARGRLAQAGGRLRDCLPQTTTKTNLSNEPTNQGS